MQNQQKAKTAVVAVDLARVAMAKSQQLVADASSSDPFMSSFHLPSCLLLLSDTPSRRTHPLSFLLLFIPHYFSIICISPFFFLLLIYIGRFSSIQCGAMDQKSLIIWVWKGKGEWRGARFLSFFVLVVPFSIRHILLTLFLCHLVMLLLVSSFMLYHSVCHG